MPQKEQYGTRGMEYGAWHRADSICRFVNRESALKMEMCDLDGCLFIESLDGNHDPICLIETAVDKNQEWKCASVTSKLAIRAKLPAFCVLYTISRKLNPADSRFRDIDSFRVRLLSPREWRQWYIATPDVWAKFLNRVRYMKWEHVHKEFVSSLTIWNRQAL